jgi:hypothetical protein
MEEKIIPADKTLKNRLILFFIVVAVVGVFIINYTVAYFGELKQLAGTDPAAAMNRVVQVINILLPLFALSVAATGLYCIVMAVRIIKSGQCPPPGTRVIRDTRIITGERALNRARAMIIFSIAIILLGVAVSWYFQDIFNDRLDGESGNAVLEQSIQNLPPDGSR